MAMSEAEASGPPRVPMSRARVLDAAIRLADAEGIESLTMRRLAQELGVEAMTLYYYVSRKDEILDAIVDIVVGEIRLPSAGAGWKAAVRATAISAHEVLVRHPWAASLMLSPSRMRPARLRYMDGLLGSLRQGGFSAVMTHHAYHVLDSYISGFTLWEVHFQVDPDELPDFGATFLRELPAGEYPYLEEHVEQHLRGSEPEDGGEFQFGLDLILDGLERISLRD